MEILTIKEHGESDIAIWQHEVKRNDSATNCQEDNFYYSRKIIDLKV